ncbi:MAG: hypothetical protein RL120_08870 [Gammaproteobacteria bacterium]
MTAYRYLRKASAYSDELESASNLNSAFKTEFELVKFFETTAVSSLTLDSTGIVTEFSVSSGIADIVFYELRKDWERSIPLSGISNKWAYTLKALPYRKSFSTSEFTEITGVTRRTALNVLQNFSEKGWCDYSKPNEAWVKIRQPTPIANKFYAIEAKLKDWKRALYQATRYKLYAQESWVLMDHDSINPAIDNIDEFKLNNIGLCSVSSTGSIEVHHVPTASKTISPQYYWEANSELAKKLLG